MDTQNYKRTVAGSVGAGVGAIFGASGKTYFILEHKSSSKYHQAGEAQKIIVDQVELGRDAGCQIRFDETFETVSRRHAAIVRDGEGWKLIHLSQSNPTLVNGQPIHGAYYLQNGDEIQLSVNGPRLGFIVPQGKQALTSSIGLTERMNLFRKQALRPYKRAIAAMAVVLVVAVGALGAWNFKLGTKNELLAQKVETYQMQLDSLDNERAKLVEQQVALEQRLRDGDENARAELEQVRSQLGNVNSRISYVRQEIKSITPNDKVNISSSGYGDDDDDDNYSGSDIASAGIGGAATTVSGTSSNIAAVTTPSNSNASHKLTDYYNDIYTMKIDRIEVEHNGRSFDPGIATSGIICGTGFILDNGAFITDRQNIEPWVYTEGNEWKEDWRRKMAEFKACGANIIIHYRAYSNRGTGQCLTFTNQDFAVNRSSDKNLNIEIAKIIRRSWKNWFGDEISKDIWVKKNVAQIQVVTDKSSSYGYIRNLGKGGGIPYNSAVSSNLPGGTELHLLGHAGHTDIHNLTPRHQNLKTAYDDTDSYNSITLQGRVGERGYYGSPAFLEDEDGYKVVGVMVGTIDGKDRLVPINRIIR